MIRCLLLSTAGSMLLIGCQTHNPYQAEGLPLPPAPIAAASHFDTSAYPVKRNKKIYVYWCWQEQSLDSTITSNAQENELLILAEQLEQHALRPAQSEQLCELRVTLESRHSQRIRYEYDDYPSARYGSSYSYHDRDRFSGIGAEFPIGQRSYVEHFQQLTLTFTDAQTSQIVWSAQNQASTEQNTQASERSVREAINTMLKGYHQN